jgi:hypothetical protein
VSSDEETAGWLGVFDGFGPDRIETGFPAQMGEAFAVHAAAVLEQDAERGAASGE